MLPHTQLWRWEISFRLFHIWGAALAWVGDSVADYGSVGRDRRGWASVSPVTQLDTTAPRAAQLHVPRVRIPVTLHNNSYAD